MVHSVLRPLFVLSLAAPLAAVAAANADVPLLQRMAAARTTAQTAAACVPAQPFYWEIGNSQRLLAAGQVGSNAPARSTQMSIASASKWIYSAYVAERRGGVLTNIDIKFLNFKSGYTNFKLCLPTQSVSTCMNSALNGYGQKDSATEDLFDYNGGHMQKHAMLMGLGLLGSDGLATAVRQGLSVLGSDWAFSYVQAQPAGGGSTTASDYSRFLRATLKGDLKIAALLGTHPVCTNPKTCPNQAVKTPIPETESWHYSVGHWVEDDPVVGDGAFSSPGAFGFYPWIDADKQYYGIVAREEHQVGGSGDPSDKPAVQSVQCGRLIRAAWLDGQARP